MVLNKGLYFFPILDNNVSLYPAFFRVKLRHIEPLFIVILLDKPKLDFTTMFQPSQVLWKQHRIWEQIDNHGPCRCHITRQTKKLRVSFITPDKHNCGHEQTSLFLIVERKNISLL
jgi:hypothetical protein